MNLLIGLSALGGGQAGIFRKITLVFSSVVLALCFCFPSLADETDTAEMDIVSGISSLGPDVSALGPGVDLVAPQICSLKVATPTNWVSPEIVNDPLKLPLLEWIRLRSIDEMKSGHPSGNIAKAHNFYVDTRDLPITAKNMMAVYRAGGKLYQHFDRFDTETGAMETHRWEFPAFRGVNEMSGVKRQLAVTGLLSKMTKTIYPHRLPHPTNKRTQIPDENKPAYAIRFNHDPKSVITQCANSERLSQDTTTKEKRRDVDGHAMLTTATWLSLEVQATLNEMVELGSGYTLGVYTTEHHPQEIAAGTKGGKLVAGAIGIVVDGVYTGVSLFMDRSHDPEKKNDMYYDGAGRLAFFAELDFLESKKVAWIDSVTVNQAARDFGGRFYTREQFNDMIETQQKALFAMELPDGGVWKLRFPRWEKTKLLTELATLP